MQISLVKRLVFSSIAITVIAIVLICALFYYSTTKFSERYLANELVSRVEFLKEAFREPLWSFDKTQIEHISKSILFKSPYSYVSYVKVEANDGEILFEKDIDSLERNKDVLKDYDHAHKITFEVVKDQTSIGQVTLIITNKGSINTIKKYLGYIVFISIFCLILFSFIIGIYFHKILSSPLKQLLNQVKHFEKEEYHFFNTNGLPFELHSVSKALNHAGEMIEKRNSDIKRYTNELEDLVEERTNALKDQMQKNISSARLAAIGEIAAGVAHEINNPLTVIDLHIAKLKKNLTDPDLQKSLEKMQAMIKRTTIIIKGLKTLSRDGIQDPIVPFNVKAMIEEVKSLVDMKITSNNINFECSDISNHMNAEGRVVQISQVLVNLIVNAVDAVNATDREIKTIKLEVIEFQDQVIFSIQDNGIGIPEKYKERIMQPFFTTKEVNKGTGLGLSISKNIVEEHGGRLELTSDENGACFKFSLKTVKSS